VFELLRRRFTNVDYKGLIDLGFDLDSVMDMTDFIRQGLQRVRIELDKIRQ
jgi:hypothetical protein